jgi:HAD superfamily hydrolase (TIGR01509 family)
MSLLTFDSSERKLMKDFDTPVSRTPVRHEPILGVALDMDGLLFDTERLYWTVGDTILQRRGARYTKELQARMMGRIGLAAIAEMIAFHKLTDSPQALLEESDELYGQMLAEELRPMPGLQRWIGLLQASGLPFGLATSSRRLFVDVILGTTDWASSLAFILTGDDVTNGKPHPEMYLKAAAKMSIHSSRMLVLEDSGNGTAAAVAAGAVTVSVPSPHTLDQDFSGAYLVADSLSDPRLERLL